MRMRNIFLLLYSGVFSLGPLCTLAQNSTSQNYTSMPDPPTEFLMCVGVPSGPGAEHQHILNLKGLMEATINMIKFMRLTLTGVPVLDLSGELDVNSGGVLQNDDVIRAWLQIRVTPLLSSMSQQFISCLASRNFSCHTYQIVVQELSQHFSGLDPVRQRWIYDFFMYPFLSRNSTAGCVVPDDSSEDWLIKNFGSFSVLARFRDFTSFNMLFSGLEVLHLLSPSQKAELLLHPEIAHLDNGSLSVVFDSLMASLNHSGGVNNGSVLNPALPTLYPSSAQDPLQQVLNGFMTAFKPVGSFVNEFVSLTHQPNLTSMRSATLVQAMLNWTLAELAAPFKQSSSDVQQIPATFDPTDVNAWFAHVVLPILSRYLPGVIPDHLTAVFHELYYIETGMEGRNETQDRCSVTLDETTCAATDLVEHVAKILHCAASVNLTLNEETLHSLTLHLANSINTLLNQLVMTNFSSPDSPFIHILDSLHEPTPVNLQDELFITTWFQMKLRPILSRLTADYLLCLSAKNFSCSTYQILVKGMSDNLFLMREDEPHLVYQYFIVPFLTNQTATGGCMTNSSSEWVVKNLGGFSPFASLMEMYMLDRNFNALEALSVLTPRQRAQLIVEDLPGLPDKRQIINIVFDYVLNAPLEQQLPDMLYFIISFAAAKGPDCSSIQLIVSRLYQADVPLQIKPIVLDSIDQLRMLAPPDCFLPPTCLSIQVNETVLCAGVHSDSVNISCSTGLEELACAQRLVLSAEDLAWFLRCKMSSNITYSREMWKLFFTKVNGVVDQALTIFSSNTSVLVPVQGVFMSSLLDVLSDLQLDKLSPDQWNNASFVMALFSNLRPFLPFASVEFLSCLSNKSFSCQSFQHVVMELSNGAYNMDKAQRMRVLKDFILPFLNSTITDPACVSSTNDSALWLLMNFGPFAEFLTLKFLISLNPHFNPLAALPYLSPAQTAELMVVDLPGLPGKDQIINTVFDYLTVAPRERRLADVLQSLVLLAGQIQLPCSFYTLVSKRLVQTLPFLPDDVEPAVYHTAALLLAGAPTGCPVVPLPTCPVTAVNESQICDGVFRPSAQDLLSSLNLMSSACVLRLEPYACSQLTGLSGEKLAWLLQCQLNNNTVYSKAIWKLLFVKNDPILDQALGVFSNLTNQMARIRGPSVSNVLDVISEVRLERFTSAQWQDVDFISTYFQQNLRPFLSSVSSDFLICLSGKNLSCPTYQHILADFTQEYQYMDVQTKQTVLNNFILPFLHRPQPDPGCVSSTNDSVEWLLMNVGPFAEFLSVRDLISLNSHFDPLAALPYLSPAQIAELIVMDLPALPKDKVINTVFDFLVESPVQRRLLDVLRVLDQSSIWASVPCSSFEIIYNRLYQALQSVPSFMGPTIWSSLDHVLERAPAGCLQFKCPVTPMNASQICQGVDSSQLQNVLTVGVSDASILCGFSLESYSCADLSALSADRLATVLQCKLNSDVLYSKDVWKLFLSKVSLILNDSLSQLSNMSVSIKGPNVPFVLEVIGELKLDTFSPEQWLNGVQVSDWLSGQLRPLLPSVSAIFLQCLYSKNFTCQTYQRVLAVFSQQFSEMDVAKRELVLKNFIQPFLSGISAGDCASSNRSDWLQTSFGPFAQLVTLRYLVNLNRNFNPVLVLSSLTSAQTAELMVVDLPGLPGKDQIINTVFDYLTVAPRERRLADVLQSLVLLAGQMPLGCPSYQTIFSRLGRILKSSPGDLEPIIWSTVYGLTLSAPRGCVLFPVIGQCLETPFNDTAVCQGVQSSNVQQYLGSANLSASCSLSIPQYACAMLTNISVDQLVYVLNCHLSQSAPPATLDSWKLFLTKVSNLLDSALLTLSSQISWTSSVPASQLLDAVRELRLDRFSPEELVNNTIISQWFGQRLRPLLPAASSSFLTCISSRNLSCQTYQTILTAFSDGFPNMNQFQQKLVLDNFIMGFLMRGGPGSACVSNDSVQWLLGNFGSFSPLVHLSTLMSLNTNFNPLAALPYLSPAQTAELMVVDLPGLPEKDQIINTVFDYLTVAPKERRLADVLQSLVLLARQTNISCSSYRTIFHRFDHLFPNLEMDLEVVIVGSKSSLLQTVPPGCVVYAGQCNTTHVDETSLCNGVNRSALISYLSTAHNGSQLCSFSVTQYACAELSGLSPADLMTVLSCNLGTNNTVSDETWKLFITKVNPMLGPALDLFTNTSLLWSRPLLTLLDMIAEVTFREFSSTNFRDVAFIQRWFQIRLRPFLPYASHRFLSCLASQNFSCDTFQTVVQIFNQQFTSLPKDTQISFYVDFIQVFLSLNQTAGCADGVQSSEWLSKNLGSFSAFASIADLQRLNPKFSLLDVLGSLNLAQLVQISSSPALLSTSDQVKKLMQYIPDSQLSQFFSLLSSVLTSQGVLLAPPVRQAFMQQVLDRANLSDPAVPDAEVQLWISNRLPPFIAGMPVTQITQYFSIFRQRSCSLSQQAVTLLNSSYSTFGPDTLQQIYNEIVFSLKGPEPLRCYVNESFYAFLQSTFMGFQFPNLTTFLSLMPPSLSPKLLNTVSPAELFDFLNRPGAVDSVTKLCELFSNYQRTEEYLKTQPVLPADLGRQTLECVWSRALNVSSQAKVDQWFNVILVRYLPFLTSQLISPTQLSGASCLAFRQFVAVMGKYNYSSVDFSKMDIYNTIRSYLKTDSPPKCYIASDPVLNSTAWFVDYIGVFINFITLDDLNMFGGSQLYPFVQNLQNLQLFDQSFIDSNVTSFYIALLFEVNPSFSALLLPVSFRCLAPVDAFTQLSYSDSLIVLESLQTCSSIDPTVSAALAENIGSVTSSSLKALGNSSTGLSTGQLSRTPPSVLLISLNVLNRVVGWSQSQASIMVQSLLTVMNISTETLLSLGTLVVGLPSTVISSFTSVQLLSAVQSSTFLTNILQAPTVVQQSIVNQIILLNSSSDGIVNNIPGDMAPLVPRSSLLTLTQSSVASVNQNKWSSEQSMLFFDLVATEIPDPDSISFDVLQGFTCTRVQKFDSDKVKSLIKGCRRRGNRQIVLQESQLTCMYSYIRTDILTNFTDYPADLLLYYDYTQVSQSLCQSYYTAVGKADFSVLSSTLSFRKQILFNSSLQCIGVSGQSVSRQQLDVLGNMVCMLSGSYIKNSDPYVIDKIKQCADLTTEQVSAVETLLLTTNTAYGVPSTWNVNTLYSLGNLPLYFSNNIWSQFTVKDKSQFFRVFVPSMRTQAVSSESIMSMMNEAGKQSKAKSRILLRTKRDTAGCTVGNITQVEANDNSFPFGYDVAQFNQCLSVDVLKDNLAGIAGKATGSDFQQVILQKVNQAYPAGISDNVLQALGPASRAATVADISKWNVTQIDTLAALMKTSDGTWTEEQVKAIVYKYLSGSGKTLGSSELNTLGGTNLCALDVSVLQTITPTSLQKANALSISNCTTEKKQVLFSIAQTAFSDSTLKITRASNNISPTSYQLIQKYLSGADITYIRTLAASNVNMDLNTFITLNPSVVNMLSVSEVKGLLGSYVPDLKTYANNPVVRTWISLQLQSDLDKLGIGLTGGRADTTATTVTVATSSTSTNASASNSTAAGAATTVKPTGSGTSPLTVPGLQQLLLLAVTIAAALQLLHS